MKNSTVGSIGLHFKNFLNGARQVLVLFPEQGYIRPNSDGFKKDVAALSGDFTKVGDNLRNGLTKNVKNNER